MSEREDILEALAAHRRFLLFTVQGLTDDQARLKSTVSALTLGGVIKHVALTEKQWVQFVLDGPDALAMTWMNTVNTYGPIRDPGGGQYASLGLNKYDTNDTFRLVAFDSKTGSAGDWKALTPLQNITGS